MLIHHASILLAILALFFSFISIINAVPVTETRLVRRAYSVDDPDMPPAVRSICPGGANTTTITNSTMLGESGVRMTTGVCGPVEEDEDDSEPATTNLPVVVNPVCVTAPNDCVSRFGTTFQGNGWVGKCGAPCTSSCYGGSGGPNPNHCQVIANSLWRRPRSEQLFTLEPNNFILLSHLSCGTGIQNQIAPSSIGCSQKMIYDFADWGSVASYLAWNCQAFQGARGGRCTGNTGLYQPSVPDFYIQVYTNS